MSKRGGKKGKGKKFERHDRDAYPTPPAAVEPLIPWLDGIRTFAEPCCDDGALARQLEAHGLRCIYQGDITTGQDALALDSYGSIDAIITNPPWKLNGKRTVMHRMIAHFGRIAPTWLLLEADWASTKQAVPFLASCTDILAIGRVIWIPGTTKHGFDNAAWYRFDARHTAGPVLHPFRSAPTRAARCGQCREPYRPRRSSARFCSDACRQRAHRAKLISVTLA